MKYLTLVILFFATLAVPGQKKLNEINLEVNGVGSGTSYSTVIRRIGKPLRIKKEKYTAEHACSGDAETHLTLIYSGLEITLLGDGKGKNLSVVAIEVTSNKWMASGISLGANILDLANKFGQPISRKDKSGALYYYYVTRDNLGGVNFVFRDKKLIKITMSETLC